MDKHKLFLSKIRNSFKLKKPALNTKPKKLTALVVVVLVVSGLIAGGLFIANRNDAKNKANLNAYDSSKLNFVESKTTCNNNLPGIENMEPGTQGKEVFTVFLRRGNCYYLLDKPELALKQFEQMKAACQKVADGRCINMADTNIGNINYDKTHPKKKPAKKEEVTPEFQKELDAEAATQR